MSTRFQAVVMLALLATCRGGGGGPITPRNIAIATSPRDLTTDLGPTPRLSILLSDSSGQPLDSLLAEATADATLTSAAGASIPVTSNSKVIGDVGNSPSYVIELVPMSVLSNGWYEFSVGPAIVAQATATQRLTRLASGRSGARFTVESAPVLAGLFFCNKGAGTFLTLSFSEPVAIPSGSPLSAGVTVFDVNAQVALSCRVAETADSGPSFDPTVPTNEWRLDCGSLPAKLRVELTAEVKSATGVVIRQLGAASTGFAREFTWASLPKADACFVGLGVP